MTFRILKEIAVFSQVRGQRWGVFETLFSTFSTSPTETFIVFDSDWRSFRSFHLFVSKRTAKTLLGSKTKPKYESSRRDCVSKRNLRRPSITMHFRIDEILIPSYRAQCKRVSSHVAALPQPALCSTHNLGCDGVQDNKQNCFDDFIACGQYLVDQRSS